MVLDRIVLPTESAHTFSSSQAVCAQRGGNIFRLFAPVLFCFLARSVRLPPQEIKNGHLLANTARAGRASWCSQCTKPVHCLRERGKWRPSVTCRVVLLAGFAYVEKRKGRLGRVFPPCVFPSAFEDHSKPGCLLLRE